MNERSLPGAGNFHFVPEFTRISFNTTIELLQELYTISLINLRIYSYNLKIMLIKLSEKKIFGVMIVILVSLFSTDQHRRGGKY